MFCLKCGEPIPDGSKACPICGAVLSSDSSDQVIVYASQKELIEAPETQLKEKNLLIRPFVGVKIAVFFSFVFLALNYMSISIQMIYYGSYDTNYNGYHFIKCLGGTARLSGFMVILLIIVNLLTLITAILGIKGTPLKKQTLKKLIIIEDVLYLISTIVPLFNIIALLKEFDETITATNIGIGCYLNILVAIFMIIMYISVFSKKLKD